MIREVVCACLSDSAGGWPAQIRLAVIRAGQRASSLPLRHSGTRHLHSGARLPAFVIPGRRNAPSPESITTELRLGNDGAPVVFAIDISGYGFRARCFASPRNDGGGHFTAAPPAVTTAGSRIGESIATELRLGNDGAPVVFDIDISGYGFRARCFTSPRIDSGGQFTAAAPAVTTAGSRIGESIATESRLGNDGAPVVFDIDISGYGFRARCFASPRNDGGGHFTAAAPAVTTAGASQSWRSGRPVQAALALDFATWVAIASISGGDRQS
jgi:hypothetical protein